MGMGTFNIEYLLVYYRISIIYCLWRQLRDVTLDLFEPRTDHLKLVRILITILINKRSFYLSIPVVKCWELCWKFFNLSQSLPAESQAHQVKMTRITSTVMLEITSPIIMFLWKLCTVQSLEEGKYRTSQKKLPLKQMTSSTRIPEKKR